MIQVLRDWTVIFRHWISKEGTLKTHRCKGKWTCTFSDLLRHAFWLRHTHLLNQRRTDSSSPMNMVCHAACLGILNCPFSFPNSETWFEICCFRDYRVCFWYFCVIISSYDTYIFKLLLLLPCVHIACVCAFTHVTDLCGAQRAILKNRFSSSDFMWGLGIEFRSWGLRCKHLYLLRHLVGPLKIFYKWFCLVCRKAAIWLCVICWLLFWASLPVLKFGWFSFVEETKE